MNESSRARSFAGGSFVRETLRLQLRVVALGVRRAVG